jgi:hypothetical protein
VGNERMLRQRVIVRFQACVKSRGLVSTMSQVLSLCLCKVLAFGVMGLLQKRAHVSLIGGISLLTLIVHRLWESEHGPRRESCKCHIRNLTAQNCNTLGGALEALVGLTRQLEFALAIC